MLMSYVAGGMHGRKTNAVYHAEVASTNLVSSTTALPAYFGSAQIAPALADIYATGWGPEMDQLCPPLLHQLKNSLSRKKQLT